MWEVTERAMRMGSSLLPEMAGNIPITFAKNGRACKGWQTIKGKRYFFYQGTGKLAGVRVENKSLTNKKGLVSVFNKNGVCTRQYYKKKK